MTNSAEPSQNVKSDTQVAGSNAPVLLKGEIEIYPDQRLSHLDQGPVKAYAALGRGKEKAFALICEKPFVPQVHAASKYTVINSVIIPKLLGTGIVDWSPSRQQRYVFVYENKLGQPLASPANFMGMGLKADTVLHHVAKKFIPLLKDMRDNDFVHGNLRVTNLYNGGGTGLEKIMLGECLSTPPAYNYFPIYEPLERSVAQNIGRGSPNYSDEMFSLGVMLTIMIRAADPMAGWSDKDILTHRLENGTYQALTGKERFSGNILELLRGLLQDDPKQRWTIDEALSWFDGQRVSHKQGGPQKAKAARPIEFFGEKFLRPQVLASEMGKNPGEVTRIYDNGELKLWMNRSIQDKALEENVDRAVSASKEMGSSGEAYHHRMSAFIGAALAPGYPIIYKGLSLFPEAFGRALAESYALQKDVTAYAEIIQSSLASFWNSMRDPSQAENAETITKMEACRGFLKQTAPGYGLERCLYTLCPEAPCISEKLKDFYVRTPEELLLAYEQIAQSPGRPEKLLDRHIIAMLSVKERVVIDPFIPDLNSNDPIRVPLATIKTFAAIQRRLKMPPLPALTSWLSEGAEPLINKFHDRDRRALVRAQILKIKDKGDLSRIEQLFDNAVEVQQDNAGFVRAGQEYNALKQEFTTLDNDLKNDPKFGYGAGRHIATLVSGIVAALIIIGIVIYKLNTRTPF